MVISAGTVAETLIVAGRRRVGEDMERPTAEFGFEIVDVNPASARRVAAAYQAWGNGLRPAALDFGDCFAYAIAKDYGCRLPYVGEGLCTGESHLDFLGRFAFLG